MGKSGMKRVVQQFLWKDLSRYIWYMLYFYEYDGSIVQLFINLLVKVIFKMFKNNNYYYSLRYYDTVKTYLYQFVHNLNFLRFQEF